MQASTLHGDVMVKRVPGGQLDLSHLTDKEVLSETRRLVGHSNHLFAALLVHLAEVESRGLHRQRACSSLYTYCIYELRMSEDAAARRSAAARWVRKFPALREAIARGELHLTGLLMIAPHLTEANQQEVLARARYRTKKELGRLVRELHPLPPVPDSMEPIRLVPKSPRNSSWELYMAALAGPVRKLKPGEHPHEWATEPAPRPNATVANDASMPPVAAGPSDVNAPSGVREAYRRDERRCTFVDERGVRCQETHLLELHHIEPFARRGPDTAANLTLRCAAHNALAAEHEASHERESEQRPRAALSTDGPGAHFRRAE